MWCHNSSIQRRLLVEQSLTLKTVCVPQYSSPMNTVVHMVTHRQRGAEHKMGTENPCHRCGGKHLPQQYHFKTSVCHACKKRGNLARMRKLQGGRSGQGQGSKAQPTHLLESGEVEPHTAESCTLFPMQSQRVSLIHKGKQC